MLLVDGAFIVGLPHDREDIIQRTSDAIENAQIGHVSVGIATPYPATPLYEKLNRENRIIHREWDKYDLQTLVFRHPTLSEEQIYEARNKLNTKSPSILFIQDALL
jgi:radical SAM superfamily enzyme YgiQ (UPF0313 family)